MEGLLDIRLPCSVCGRRFAPDALERHENVCEKMAQKKRRVFDSSKQRLTGTDIPTVRSAPTPSTSGRKREKPSWRQKHSELISALQAARSGGSAPARTSVPSDYTQCPHCERYFSDKAADRHINWCEEQKSRIPRNLPPAEEKERFEARKSYRAPLPNRRNKSPVKGQQSPVSPVKQTSFFPIVEKKKSRSPYMENSSVKVTGRAIPYQSRFSDNGILGSFTPGCSGLSRNNSKRETKKPLSRGFSQPAELLSDGGMSTSSSWEWESQPLPTAAKNVRNGTSVTKSGQNRPISENYDPYVRAQQQLQELLNGSGNNKRNTTWKNESNSPHDSSWSIAGDYHILPETKPKNGDSYNKIPSNGRTKNKTRKPPRPSGGEFADDEDENDAFEAIERSIRETAQLEEKRPSRTGNQSTSANSKHNEPNTISVLSQDSDYGSLMRRSPSSPSRVSPHTPMSWGSTSVPLGGGLLDGWSASSGSESSLPPLGIIHTNKMPRFCHECGTEYPVANAKFCCECGLRRLTTV